MNKMETTCIMCPIGCHLVVTRTDSGWVVEGNRCPRGEKYGIQEASNPMRTITTVYIMKDGSTLNVRTKGPVEKAKYFEVLRAIKTAPEPVNPRFGTILVKNVLNTGVDVMVTAVNKD